VVGATSVSQLEETLAAAQVTLPQEALDDCRRISREIPYPMG
jgi:aryl-alcohol dehydrogenase-like predicted oxidoreductase